MELASTSEEEDDDATFEPDLDSLPKSLEYQQDHGPEDAAPTKANSAGPSVTAFPLSFINGRQPGSEPIEEEQVQ